jgi:hypothetical protein
MKLRTILLAGAVFALAAPAHADDDAVMKRLDKMQKMIEAQQHQIAAQNSEIDDLRHALGKKSRKTAVTTATAEPASAPAPTPAPVEERLAKQQVQIDQLAHALDNTDTAVKLDKQDRPAWSFANGRPTVTSPDGRFSLSLRLLGQFDAAYYMQNNSARILPNGPDLSSGGNFRRAQTLSSAGAAAPKVPAACNRSTSNMTGCIRLRCASAPIRRPAASKTTRRRPIPSSSSAPALPTCCATPSAATGATRRV